MRAQRLTFALIFLALGCGYRLVDASQVFGPSVRRIEIRPFTNESREAGFERLLADSLIEEFSRRGVLTPVYGAAASPDLILRGSVTRLRARPSAFDSVALSVEETVEVDLDVSVERAATRESVWHRDDMSFVVRFLASPDPQTHDANKEQALLRLTAEVAARIHDELFLQQF